MLVAQLVALLPGPAQAAEPADPISGLVGGLVGIPGTGSAAEEPAPSTRAADYGYTRGRAGVLRRGCRNYPYRYVLHTPTDDWTLETFLRDPKGQGVGSGAFTAGPDPVAQQVRFRLCRWATRPGRFTIRAKLTWYDSHGQDHVVWLPASHFRLRRPR